MTRNPNTRVEDLHAAKAKDADKGKDALTLGSLFAAGFILMVSFIMKRFYE
ncbi:hypothetical protein [Arabiibacter massiliensis]|uniref:hypothetical protein n=1 Tax=Arabiibacter massiliensis TaxID=1870985 RepID=UPI00155A618D|nr:hypothetical protein [Arabiibacter massiliensis]